MKSKKKFKYPFARISDREIYVRIVGIDIYTSTTATSCKELSLHDWRQRILHKYGNTNTRHMCGTIIKSYNDRLGPQIKLRGDFLISTSTEKCDSDTHVEKRDCISISPDSAIARSL